jgi:enoyl-CoA hydratase
MIDLAVAGPIAKIVMSRPPVNAIDDSFVGEFERAIDSLERDSAVGAVMICSTQKTFSAGADLNGIKAHFASDDGPRQMVGYVRRLHQLFFRIERLPIVTLAAIKGAALGGGLELALSCDLRLASRSAVLGLPEARVGMIPGAGGTQRLTRLCGIGVASRLILSGEMVNGDEAERLGLVQWSVSDADFEQRAQAVMDRVTSLSRPALAAAKDCLFAYFDPAVDGYARELEKPLTLMKTPEARNRIEDFLSRRGR